MISGWMLGAVLPDADRARLDQKFVLIEDQLAELTTLLNGTSSQIPYAQLLEERPRIARLEGTAQELSLALGGGDTQYTAAQIDSLIGTLRRDVDNARARLSMYLANAPGQAIHRQQVAIAVGVVATAAFIGFTYWYMRKPRRRS